MLLDPANALGHVVPLARTEVRHFDALGRVGAPLDAPQKASFNDFLKAALEGTNQSLQNADGLIREYNLNPNSVTVDQVTNAMAEAQMNLSLAKNVIERSLAAYREITNMR